MTPTNHVALRDAVVLIAVLVATYQMFRLESQRTRHGVEVEQEVRVLLALATALLIVNAGYAIRLTSM